MVASRLPAALNALAGLRAHTGVATALKNGGPDDLSTFYGFYVIEALGSDISLPEGVEQVE